MSAQLSERGNIELLRIPPHDINAEQAVLGGLMLDPESLPKVADWLSEGDFYRKDYQAIYRAICALADRKQPVDAVTLGDWFAANDLADVIGGPVSLYELQANTASSANIVAHAEIVVEKSRLRSLIDAGSQIVEKAWTPGTDPQLVTAEAMHHLSQMQASKLRGGLEPAKMAMRKFHAQMQERYQRGPGLLGEPWPWKDLNDATNGLRDGVLYVVGARPSMGKSVFGLQTAVFNAMRGHRTAFFSIEMGAEECMARAVACKGEIPHTWVEHPNDDDADAEWYWSRMDRAIEDICNSPLLIDETPAMSARQLIARARRSHMQAPLRLIVVDHMHDMEIDAKNARFDYGVITQTGKIMAKEFRCPVILLAQLNRASANRNDKEPTMTDLRESGEIEQKADIILFLHRNDYYDPQDQPGVVKVILAKGRNIKTGQPIYLQNQFSQMRLEDWIGPLPPRKEQEKGKGKGMQ